jgi:hypothetical protein
MSNIGLDPAPWSATSLYCKCGVRDSTANRLGQLAGTCRAFVEGCELVAVSRSWRGKPPMRPVRRRGRTRRGSLDSCTGVCLCSLMCEEDAGE